MRIILSVPLLFLALSCNQNNKIPKNNNQQTKKYADVDISFKNDTLVCFRTVVKDGYGSGSPCGYINKNSDTVFQMDKFKGCFTDTFITYAFVVDEKLDPNNIVAINLIA